MLCRPQQVISLLDDDMDVMMIEDGVVEKSIIIDNLDESDDDFEILENGKQFYPDELSH
jgi:hypothetical protein